MSISYCVLLITKEIPNEIEIQMILSKYLEDDIYEDYLYLIGGKFNGMLKLKVDFGNKDWNSIHSEKRNGKLFHSCMLTTICENNSYDNEEYYYNSMGYRDSYLYVDGAKIKDIINFSEVDCYICIDDVDENILLSEYWNGDEFIENKDFDEELKTIKSNSQNYFATILEIFD